MYKCSVCGGDYAKKTKRSSQCQPCRTKRQREYCQRTGYHKKRYAITAAAERERHLVRKYSITQAEYEAMFDHQDGACVICDKKQSRPFDVDHCHHTGKVRGLLCTNCNRMLGHAHDDISRLNRAVYYLENPPASSRKSRQNLSAPQVKSTPTTKEPTQ